jgi:hypothetical protein
MAETALDRNVHFPDRHRARLNRHHVDDRAEHHPVVERRKDGEIAGPRHQHARSLSAPRTARRASGGFE